MCICSELVWCDEFEGLFDEMFVECVVMLVICLVIFLIDCCEVSFGFCGVELEFMLSWIFLGFEVVVVSLLENFSLFELEFLLLNVIGFLGYIRFMCWYCVGFVLFILIVFVFVL